MYDLERLRAALWSAVDELERHGMTHALDVAVYLAPMTGPDADTAKPAEVEGFSVGRQGEVMADRLEGVFGPSAQMWLNLQASYERASQTISLGGSMS